MASAKAIQELQALRYITEHLESTIPQVSAH